MYQYQEMFHIQ